MSRVLLVEDDDSVRSTVQTVLELEGYAVEAKASTDDALQALQERAWPLVITDVYIDSRTGLDILKAARAADEAACVIVMSGRGSMETVMAATRGGAFDYLAKPFEIDQLLEVVRRAEASRKQNEKEADDIDDLPATEMIGSSAPMVDIYKVISRVAPTDATVLIEGQSGTGKEMVARMIHNNSRRSEGPFVAVDCGAIPATLLESELFGAMRGAFTGADRDRVGYFETAHQGTVFLDEIGDIDAAFQLKLLRFLQEREVRPLGSSRARAVDVRVVAATNKDLQKQVEEGRFREDLWFRMNTIRIPLPALRERRGDIPLLAHYFLKLYNERYALQTRLLESGLRALEEQSWPGNVRQLQHSMERMVILAREARITDETVYEAMRTTQSAASVSESLNDTEREQIRKVLQATNGNKSRAARLLGIERKTLYRKLERMEEEAKG
jgi:DNA-binding NtrC family response regulator